MFTGDIEILIMEKCFALKEAEKFVQLAQSDRRFGCGLVYETWGVFISKQQTFRCLTKCYLTRQQIEKKKTHATRACTRKKWTIYLTIIFRSLKFYPYSTITMPDNKNEKKHPLLFPRLHGSFYLRDDCRGSCWHCRCCRPS